MGGRPTPHNTDYLDLTEATRLVTDVLAVDRKPEAMVFGYIPNDVNAAAIGRRLVGGVAVLIERQVRERIAAGLREAVEAVLYDGDHDRPLIGYYELLDHADRIAAGEQP
jgi:hypothetical protein